MAAKGFTDAGSGQARPSGWAWALCWLMFASTTLNYMDRQAISLVRPQVSEEFGLSFAQFGWVMAAFQLTYALAQVPAGLIADRVAVGPLYAGAVLAWSGAAMASGFAPTLGVLIAFRVLLGFGESFNWPCALKVTEKVLPPRDRSLGNGIFNSGAAVGAVLTPLIVPLLAQRFGWRMAFVAIGALGVVWVIVWLALTSPLAGLLRGGKEEPIASDPDGFGGNPSAAPTVWIGFAVLTGLSIGVGLGGYRLYGLPAVWLGVALMLLGTLVLARALPMEQVGAGWVRRLAEVVRLRRFWVLFVVSISINISWHFLVSWMPSYLQSDRKMTYMASGLFSALPFLAADFGNLGGGFLSMLLARRGLAPERARWVVMALCALLVNCGVAVGFVEDNNIVLVLLALMALGAAAFMANYFAFCQEVSQTHTGLVVGVLGGVGNLFAAGILPLAGFIKDQVGGFWPIFGLVGFSPWLGVAALALAWGWGAGPKRTEAQTV